MPGSSRVLGPDPRALARLHAAAFITPRPWTVEDFAALLADPLVFLEGDARGFVMGRAVAGEAELLTIAVDPALRRRGRACTLLAAFDATSRARGATEAFLEVAADNAPARALYAATGWHRRGRRPAYYRAPDGTRIDAEILGKSLS